MARTRREVIAVAFRWLARVYHVRFDKDPIDSQSPCSKSRRIHGLCHTVLQSDPFQALDFRMT